MRTCDVLCIGGGGAGVTAAVEAASQGARVILVSKEPVGYGNTRLIGGIVAHTGLDPEDDPRAFLEDLVRSGEGLADRRLCEVVAEESPRAAETMERFGAFLGRDPQGRFPPPRAFIRAGGHGRARSLLIPGKGQALGWALRTAAQRAGVELHEETMAAELLVEGGRVIGAVCLNLLEGRPFVILAKRTVLATGGGGWLYWPHTDVTRASTGDGYGLALLAGATLRDMEQVQFIPFAITRPRSMVGILCGEPFTAGPRGRLVNQRGEEILTEVARRTRAEVARAIALEVAGGGRAWLDLRDNRLDPAGEFIYELYTQGLFRDLGEAVRFAYGRRAYRWEEPWEVYPCAHYTMGGVRIDEHGRTEVEGLLAVGEVTGGLHGGNRLGSVSLSELFVFGLRCGREAARARTGPLPSPSPGALQEAVGRVEALRGSPGRCRPLEAMGRLQRAMWEGVGPARTESGIRQALEEIRRLAREPLRTSGSRRYNLEWQEALELRLMLLAAESIALSALERRESRGAHLRLDFPQRAPRAQVMAVRLGREGLRVEVEDAHG